MKCIRSFFPDPQAESVQVPVDSDWADDKKLDKAAVQEQFSFTDSHCSHGHAHERREHFRAQRPSCTALAQEQSKVWERHNFFARPTVQTGTVVSDRLTERTRGVQANRAGSIET